MLPFAGQYGLQEIKSFLTYANQKLFCRVYSGEHIGYTTRHNWNIVKKTKRASSTSAWEQVVIGGDELERDVGAISNVSSDRLHQDVGRLLK